MKVFRLLVLLAVLILGLIIGAMNMDEMTINLLFTQLKTSVGVAIIAALLIGVIVGAVYAGMWALATFVEPQERDITVTIPNARLGK